MVSQTATGFTNTCDEVGVLGTDGYNFNLTPTDGGYDNAKLDTLKLGYYVAAGGALYAYLDLNSPVDLSAPNNVMQFSMAAQGAGGVDTTQTITVKLEASGTVVSNEESVSLSQVYSKHNVTFTAATSQVLTSVTRITFTIDNSAGASSRTGALFITKLSAGSMVTSTISATSLLSSSKLYPNPVSDMANVELNLKSASDVKVTLSDMMGKEIMTIADERTVSLNKSFYTSTLTKGIYTVNYFINGAPAKSELLVVK